MRHSTLTSLIIFSLFNFVHSGLSLKPEIVPDIWLEEYKGVHPGKSTKVDEDFRASSTFGNEFIVKNGSNYIMKGATEAVFICQCVHPIEWTVPQISQFSNLKQVQFSSESERISELNTLRNLPQNKLFKSYLSLSYVDGTPLSVQFACAFANSSKAPSPQATIHLSVDEINNLRNSSKTSPSADTVVKPKSLMQPHSNLRGQAKIVVNDFAKCCTGNSSTRPKAYAESCRNGFFQCELLLHKYMANLKLMHTSQFDDPDESDCVRVNGSFFMPGFIYCEGNDISYLGKFVEVFRPAAANLTWRKEEFFNRPTINSVISLTKYKDVGNNKNLIIEEKMLIMVGHNGADKSGRPLSLFIDGHGHFPHYNLRSSSKNENRVNNILEYGRNYYYEKETLKIMCFGVKYFYDFGAHLRLNWKNGTQSILERNRNESIHKLYFYGKPSSLKVFGGRVATATTYFASDVKASLEMESVDCFMPVSKSVEWDTLNYPIQVLPGSLPKISEEEETVRLNLNESRTVICEVKAGLPEPEVNVTRNGMVIYTRAATYRDKPRIRVKINLSIAQEEEKATYQCIAVNVRGKVIKTYTVALAEDER